MHVSTSNFNFEEYAKTDNCRSAFDRGGAGVRNFIRHFQRRRGDRQGRFVATLEDLKRNTPDIFISTPMQLYFILYATIILNIPSFSITLQVLGYNKDHCILGLPTLPFGVHYYLLMFFLRFANNEFKIYDAATVQLGKPCLTTVFSKRDYMLYANKLFCCISTDKQIFYQSPIIG